MKMKIADSILELSKGDITRERVDAIVNAANSRLAGGGGVDGAIHRAGGPEIMAECRKIGGCPTGRTVATTAGRLAAKKVLHTVGPIWQGGGRHEPELLASCYLTALELARQFAYDSIAFPSISTGVYAYPVAAAAHIALQTISDFLHSSQKPNLVKMVLFDDHTYNEYEKAAKDLGLLEG